VDHVRAPQQYLLMFVFLDVIKTRLQVEARTGQTSYKGIADAFTKICESDLDW
jgi:hypothetical protein